MSLVAPHEYWEKRRLYSLMYSDTMASVMDLSEEKVMLRIKLAKDVIKNSEVPHPVLGGGLDDEAKATIKVYIKMMKMVKKNPTTYVPEPCVGSFGMASYKYKEDKDGNRKL